MVSIWGRKRTLADKTVFKNGSIDIGFEPPMTSLANIFKVLSLSPCEVYVYYYTGPYENLLRISKAQERYYT
jgi:hypothetical protein